VSSTANVKVVVVIMSVLLGRSETRVAIRQAARAG